MINYKGHVKVSLFKYIKMTLKLILGGLIVTLIYGVLLYWMIKSETKRDKKNIFVSNKNGIKYRYVRPCWIPNETNDMIYIGWLMLKLEDTENVLENIPIAFRLSWIKQNLKSLEEKEKEEKDANWD